MKCKKQVQKIVELLWERYVNGEIHNDLVGLVLAVSILLLSINEVAFLYTLCMYCILSFFFLSFLQIIKIDLQFFVDHKSWVGIKFVLFYITLEPLFRTINRTSSSFAVKATQILGKKT